MIWRIGLTWCRPGPWNARVWKDASVKALKQIATFPFHKESTIDPGSNLEDFKISPGKHRLTQCLQEICIIDQHWISSELSPGAHCCRISFKINPQTNRFFEFFYYNKFECSTALVKPFQISLTFLSARVRGHEQPYWFKNHRYHHLLKVIHSESEKWKKRAAYLIDNV